MILTHNYRILKLWIKMHKILIVGTGNIALRVAGLLNTRYALYGLIRNSAYRQPLRDAGILPLSGDLDDRHTLGRLSGLADTILHFAPPPAAERTQIGRAHV